MIKVKQINESKESNGAVIIQTGRGYNKGGEHEDCPTISANSFENNNHVMIVAQRGRGEGWKQELEERVDGNTNTLTGVAKDNMVKICKPCRTDEAKAVRKENLRQGKDYTPFAGKELRFEDSDTMNTITTMTTKDNLLSEGVSIRRLTPVECERLQGFPDNHTQFGNYDGVVKEITKGHRYKLMGNAVTVTMVELIGRKLLNN
jgi:site-specific DNA-cytosine methylase